MRRTLVVLIAVAVAAPAAADPTADARALVERWLAAQNLGRFDDYAAIYADAFHGTKRVGATTRAMDRAAWLKDRKLMFRAPMTVAAADVKITAGADAVVVDLQQTWRQGDFADTGHKRLTLDAVATHIVGEDMLDSRVLLTEGACLTALYPGASWAKRRTGDADLDREVRAVTVLELGGWSICQVDVVGHATLDVTIGAFRYDRTWKAVDHVDLDVPDHPATSDGSTDDGITYDGSVAIAPIALGGPADVTIAVTRTTDASAPMMSDRDEKTSYYRLSAAKLDEIFTYESTRSGGEDDSANRCEPTIEPRTHRGFHDLTLACTATTDSWHGGGHTSETTTTRYVWNGTAYVAR